MGNTKLKINTHKVYLHNKLAKTETNEQQNKTSKGLCERTDVRIPSMIHLLKPNFQVV